MPAALAGVEEGGLTPPLKVKTVEVAVENEVVAVSLKVELQIPRLMEEKKTLPAPLDLPGGGVNLPDRSVALQQGLPVAVVVPEDSLQGDLRLQERKGREGGDIVPQVKDPVHLQGGEEFGRPVDRLEVVMGIGQDSYLHAPILPHGPVKGVALPGGLCYNAPMEIRWEREQEEPEQPVVPPRKRRRWWVNLLLFLITLVTTTAVGLLYQIPFLFPGKTIDEPFLRLFLRNPLHWFYGFTYSLPLMAILLAHELGHYFACRRYGIPATLPFFIPAPTLVGTFGAVIRIEEPIYSKKPLLDVGSAGPLLSFFLSLPILAWGLTLSRVEPRLAGDALQLGEPLIFTLLSRLLLPGVGPDTAILLHPLGFAGWFGILVTAFNLIPVGQLDGGHILYAASPNLHKRLAWPLIAFLVALGFLAWQGWWIWAAMIALFGTKHPPVYDSPYPLDRRRALIGLLCLVIFILSFTPTPMKLG